jgi:hypothetical protein
MAGKRKRTGQKRGDVMRHFLVDPATGETRWRHCRQYYQPDAEHPNGSKEVWWERLDGKRWVTGLGGRLPSTLPLFGAHRLHQHGPREPRVLCEGEPAAVALTEAGYVSLATVTGAPDAPDRDALSVLAGFDVVLWRDYDTPGVTMMRKIAATLRDGIAASVRWIDWHAAEPKQDAADFIRLHGRDAVIDLLEHATEREPDFSIPPGTEEPNYGRAGGRNRGARESDTTPPEDLPPLGPPIHAIDGDEHTFTFPSPGIGMTFERIVDRGVGPVAEVRVRDLAGDRLLTIDLVAIARAGSRAGLAKAIAEAAGWYGLPEQRWGELAFVTSAAVLAHIRRGEP